MTTGNLGFGRDASWRFGEGGDRQMPRTRGRPRGSREELACDGWPEIGSCGSAARKGSDYCASCDEARRAHEGTSTEDEE